MVARGFSQAELARRVGLAQPTIYGLIHTNKVGSKHLHRIARELGTTPAYLSGETDDPQADAPAAPDFDHDEVAWVELYRSLSESQRAAAWTLLRGLVDPEPARAPTMHSPTGFDRSPEHA